MVAETIVGWRRTLWQRCGLRQRTSWTARRSEVIAATLDPQLLGYAQQMFDDNQYFASVKERMKDGGFRVTAGLLDTPDEYEELKAQPPAAIACRCRPDSPNVVFSDEEDGVVAVKNGTDILYVSLYWRARFGINNLARVHYVTPNFDRIAVVREETQFEQSGHVFYPPNTTTPTSPWLPSYPTKRIRRSPVNSCPSPKSPLESTSSPATKAFTRAKARFTPMRYGPYLIAMNLTTDKTSIVQCRPARQPIKELVSGQNARARRETRRASSTVVFYFGAR